VPAPAAPAPAAPEEPAATPPAASAEAPVAPVKPAGAASSPARAAAEPPPAPEPAGAAAEECTARIDSRPDGASVRIGSKVLGQTPIASAVVPCGQSTIVFERKRWRTVTETLRASAGKRAKVSATLSRPTAQLELVSVPAGAVFLINGKEAGKAPRKVVVPRYQELRVEARLPGQKPWRGKVYVENAADKVEVGFKPGK
jgi:hypothetical protein